MLRIELSECEFGILATLLTNEIEETRVELRRSQRAECRQSLREREAALKKMRARLAG
jgi:hypothetical protein